MSDNLAIPKLFPLVQLVLHEIAKKVWNILVLRYSEKISKSSESLYVHNACYLKEYQNKVLKVLPEILPAGFPTLLKDKIVNALITVRLGYSEVFDCIYWNLGLFALFEMDDDDDPDAYDRTIRNFLSSVTSPDKSKCEISYFINPLGHFDDLSWAKILVADENQPPKRRFYLACIYCFLDEIVTLWFRWNPSNQFHIYDDFKVIAPQDRHMIELWMFFIEGDLDTLVGDDYNIYEFKTAFNGYHKHAAKYFWDSLPDDRKAIILSELDFDELALAAVNYHYGFVHFIYSLLSVELKKNLVSFTIHNPNGALIWDCLLSSYYYKTVLFDIFAFPFSIPLKFYELILDKLVSRKNKFCIPLYQEVLKILWNHLSQDE